MKKQEIVNMVFTDTHKFLCTRDNWAKVKANGQYIAFGLLTAVFDVIFSLAPSKEDAMMIIDIALEDYYKKEKN
tara:strand:+ start:42 stop:263 length:222 start_codon:yes stop_codon:yes gene_type:complete